MEWDLGRRLVPECCLSVSLFSLTMCSLVLLALWSEMYAPCARWLNAIESKHSDIYCRPGRDNLQLRTDSKDSATISKKIETTIAGSFIRLVHTGMQVGYLCM